MVYHKYMTRFFAYFRGILRNLEGDKNQLVELYYKATIVAQGYIVDPKKGLLNLRQWHYL